MSPLSGDSNVRVSTKVRSRIIFTVKIENKLRGRTDHSRRKDCEIRKKINHGPPGSLGPREHGKDSVSGSGQSQQDGSAPCAPPVPAPRG